MTYAGLSSKCHGIRRGGGLAGFFQQPLSQGWKASAAARVFQGAARSPRQAPREGGADLFLPRCSHQSCLEASRGGADGMARLLFPLGICHCQRGSDSFWASREGAGCPLLAVPSSHIQLRIFTAKILESYTVGWETGFSQHASLSITAHLQRQQACARPGSLCCCPELWAG